MSLINDALRRASQKDKERATAPSSAEGMRAADEIKSSSVPLLVVAVCVLLLAGAGWLFVRALHARQESSAKRATTIIAAAAPVVSPKPPPQVAPTSETPKTATEPVAVTPPPTPIPAEPTPPAPQFPTLKLQGIFYNRANPHALINGQTVQAGESVAGTRVAKIEPAAVIVEWNGETKRLQMTGD